MQFIVLGFDGNDENAATRRMAVRDAHLKLAKEMYDEGNSLYAAGILNDEGMLIGSMIICEFAAREELENSWLKNEPYVTGDVWREIKINRAQVAPFFSK